MNKRIIRVILILLLVVISDQILKIYLTEKHIQIIPNLLSFEYTKNFGVAFGMKYKMSIILIANVLLLVALIYIIIKKFKQISNVYTLTIILAGGISNFIDRIIYGYVRDYVNISFIKFPRFNLADIAIVLGIIIITIQVCIKKEKST